MRRQCGPARERALTGLALPRSRSPLKEACIFERLIESYHLGRRGGRWQVGQVKLDLFMNASRRIVSPHRPQGCPARP
ncbi:hypothetical protein FRAAL5801 [Frankia alni ACN14a]|uniref:Uncharacterized protein n=1 Tax=Frankia alni (strain DSM 45986 / CECT 9034 / ACN14a) TaxID=326424 RepID=Q0RDN3_FRAAA|nr:hypothetical protein FRAAL5801 [Frankia alni ACN14a]